MAGTAYSLEDLLLELRLGPLGGGSRAPCLAGAGSKVGVELLLPVILRSSRAPET